MRPCSRGRRLSDCCLLSDQHIALRQLTGKHLLELEGLQAPRCLPSSGSGNFLLPQPFRLDHPVCSGGFNLDHIKLLECSPPDNPNDAVI